MSTTSNIVIEGKHIEHSIRDGATEYGLIRHAGASGKVTKRSWYVKNPQGHWKYVQANTVPLAVRYGVSGEFSTKQERHDVVRTAGGRHASPHSNNKTKQKKETPAEIVRRLSQKLRRP